MNRLLRTAPPAVTGFTVIELMLVVAVIGILVAIAIPAYSNYSTRTKISECIGMMSSCKTTFTEYVATNSGLPPFGVSCVACPCRNADEMTKYCGALTTVNDVIEIDIKPAAGTRDSCYIRMQAFLTDNRITNWEGQTTCDFAVVPTNFQNPPRW